MPAMHTAKKITIVHVDDHLLFRESLKTLIAKWEGMEVVGETGDGRHSLQLIKKLRPGIAILDITMQGIGGLELTPRIKELVPETKILLLTMHEKSNLAHQAFAAGANGYALKSDSAEELERAVRIVARGESYICPKMTSTFINNFMTNDTAPAKSSSLSLFTSREQEVCRLLAQARSNAQIAADLCISEKTVRVHVANAMKKLSCRSRTELAIRLHEMDEGTPQR